ncbi:hypothetical protein ACFLYU_03310 [Candidatus Dependentiae bacterium]
MKRILQSLLVLTLFAGMAAYADCGCCGSCNNNCCSSCCDDCCCNNNCNCCLGPCDGYPFLAYRSQSRNTARELVGCHEFVNKYCMDSTYGVFYLGLEYQRSFRPEHLARYFFGCDLDCCNTLLVQGSQVEARNSKAWLADYFGLSPLFDTRVSFCPRIQNVMVDMHLHLNLDGWKEGMFFKIYSPITWSKWELNMCECIKNNGGEVGFDAGYMYEDEVTRAKLADSFTEAVSGTHVFGDMKEALKFGRMTNCKLAKVRLADLRASFGYNFILKEDGHLGLFVHAAAPTGNRPHSCYLFEPIVGNGKHWELGAGITGSWVFWRSKECDDRYMDVCLDATFSHMFKDCQCRSFDFCCKPNSRYMLLEEMGANTDELLSGDPVELVDYQYKKNLIPAINWSTFQVDVKISIQADVAIKLGYIRENWSFDLGYNLWARTGEKFCCDCCCDNCCDDCCNNCCVSSCSCPADKKYAIKGDAFLYGDNPQSVAYPLSATQSCADIHGGKNYLATGEYACTNPRVDNPSLALIGTNTLTCTGGNVNTSFPPILVSKNMLNMQKGPSAITHKIFAHVSHAWKDRDDCWVPFMGAGFEVEFAQKGDCCYDDCCGCCCNNCNTCCSTPCLNSCNSSCNSCCGSNCGCGSCCNDCNDDCCCTSKKAGVYQYGVWIKGGISFD